MKKYCLSILFLCLLNTAFCQSVGIGTTTPNASAMLDVSSTTKGALVPRMTSAQRLAITNPAAGLLVFDTVEKTLYMFDGQQWLGFAAQTNYQRPSTNFVYGPDNLQDTTLTGYSVSMWDQFVAIGAPYRKTGAVTTGGVYIYQYIAGNWVYSTTLTPTGNNDNSFYGTSVSLKGNYLIVGAPSHKNGASTVVGAAYIYNYNGTAWVINQTIFGATAGTDFGQTVAVNQFGTYIAVSEPGATVAALANAGTVRVYNKPSSTFILQQSLQDLSPAAGENFGSSMAMSPLGVHIIVGAPGKTVSGFYGNGYAGQFDRNGSLWTQTHSATPISENNLGLGAHVDITDGHVIFSTAKKQELAYLSLGWSGYDVQLTEEIHGVNIDPVTDYFSVFAGNTLYYSGGGSIPIKFKILSADIVPVLPNLLSGYNKNIVTGIPYGQNYDKPFVGAIYFGQTL